MPFTTTNRFKTRATGCQGKSRPASPKAASIPVHYLQNVLFSGIGQAVSVSVVQVLIPVA